jgi:PRTRC genetic system protein C
MNEITVQVIKREFRFNGKRLPDPNPKLNPEGVRGVYQAQFPELVNAILEGPILEGGVQLYRFATRVGKNG